MVPGARTDAGRALRMKLGGLLVAGPVAGSHATASVLVRLSAGIVFVLFGIGKFTSHPSEADSFTAYGLPSPDAFVYAIGVLELLGGALLIVGFLIRPAALVLAGDMVGAIIVSGIGRGEMISLTLAPALLAGMLFLVYTGPGWRSLDHYLFSGRANEPA
jgi:putative oxidoreductase